MALRPAAGDSGIRIDLRLNAGMIPVEARVLDIGCGDGAPLYYLVHFKRVDGRGIELSQAGVNACVSRGLSVIQGDADQDLAEYPAGPFNDVIVSQTLHATRNPRGVLAQLVRIGKRAVVSFPNPGLRLNRLSFLDREPCVPPAGSPTYLAPRGCSCCGGRSG